MLRSPTSPLRLDGRGPIAWIGCGVVALGLAGCSTTSSNDEFCGLDLTGDDEVGETGCMFLPGCVEDEDDGPTDKLDLEPYSSPSSPPSDMPPPTGASPTWDYDSGTQTYYRLATEFEQEEHDWPEGT